MDGLPHVGAVIYPGQAYYSKVDCSTGARSAHANMHAAKAWSQHALRPSVVDHACVCQRTLQVQEPCDSVQLVSAVSTMQYALFRLAGHVLSLEHV